MSDAELNSGVRHDVTPVAPVANSVVCKLSSFLRPIASVLIAPGVQISKHWRWLLNCMQMCNRVRRMNALRLQLDFMSKRYMPSFIRRMRDAHIMCAWLVGIGVLFISLWIMAEHNQGVAKGWPIVEGTVTESDLVPVFSESTVGTHIVQKPEFSYEYTVGMRQYKSTLYSFAQPTIPRQKIDDFPKGQGIAVRYNPVNPGEAVVDVSTRKNLLQLGIGFIVFGALFIIVDLLAEARGLTPRWSMRWRENPNREKPGQDHPRRSGRGDKEPKSKC